MTNYDAKPSGGEKTNDNKSPGFYEPMDIAPGEYKRCNICGKTLYYTQEHGHMLHNHPEMLTDTTPKSEPDELELLDYLKAYADAKIIDERIEVKRLLQKYVTEQSRKAEVALLEKIRSEINRCGHHNSLGVIDDAIAKAKGDKG